MGGAPNVEWVEHPPIHLEQMTVESCAVHRTPGGSRLLATFFRSWTSEPLVVELPHCSRVPVGATVTITIKEATPPGHWAHVNGVKDPNPAAVDALLEEVLEAVGREHGRGAIEHWRLKLEGIRQGKEDLQ